jgi:ATP-dependent Clp protease protease subunit
MKLQPRQLPALPAGVSFKDPDSGDKGRLVVRAEGDRPTISIFDTIESGFNARISEALSVIGSRPVLLEINSRGGDLFEALGAFNVLVRHPAPVDVQIVGLAASAASLIAMAGEKIEMFKSAQIMVHNAHGFVMGDHHAMAEAAKVFAGFSDTAAAIYAERTGKPKSTIAEMMDQTTWLTADQAKTAGFVDAIVDSPAPNADAQKRRDLRAVLQSKGFSRSEAKRIARLTFGGPEDDEDGNLDLDQVALAMTSSFAPLEKFL